MNKDLILKLKTTTGAGMKDCLDALNESNFNFDKALDLVKAKGLQTTARNSNKIAAEGLIGAFIPKEGLDGTLIEINSNTDFTSRSEEFKEFVAKLTPKVGNYIDLNEFTGNLDLVDMTDDLEKLKLSTKENIVIRRWARIDVPHSSNAQVFSYIHSNGKLAVLLAMKSSTESAKQESAFKEFAENVAMQIAAMNPLSISKDQLSENEINRQKSIFEAQLKELNKPEASWPKIIEGKLNKYYSEVCLLNQEAVFSPKKTISNLLEELSKKLNSKIEILNFLRWEVGQGIEVEKTDLASEVHKLAGAN